MMNKVQESARAARPDVAADRRATHREALVHAAARRIDEAGVNALRARDLAGDIGIALGGIYNLVQDMDELILLVASRTLKRLDAALTAAAEKAEADNHDATGRLVTVALAYRGFASRHTGLWRALFEHRMASDSVLPEWAVSDQMALFRHILDPLEAIAPDEGPSGRLELARTLFGATHGVVILGLDEKLVGVPLAQLDRQIERLVRAICRGL